MGRGVGIADNKGYLLTLPSFASCLSQANKTLSACSTDAAVYVHLLRPNVAKLFCFLNNSSTKRPFCLLIDNTLLLHRRRSIRGKAQEARPEAVCVHVGSSSTVLDDLRG